MSDSTLFWQEVRRSLMVRGDEWKPVIESLPDHVSASEAKQLIQSADQLTVLQGQGYIAGGLIESTPLKMILLAHVNDSELNLENITLQWLYRFIIVESLLEHVRKEPMAKWPPMFLHMVEQGLNFLVYMAALLVLIEEKKVSYEDWVYGNGVKKYLVPLSGFAETETLVKNRVAEACAFLHPKAQDYGESFRRHGLPGLMPRLWDKIARYAQLKADNRAGNFEKKEDSARDLLGYCCIAYSLMLELPKELRISYQPSAVYETDSNVAAGAKWKKVN
jgi:hypothetical protein